MPIKKDKLEREKVKVRSKKQVMLEILRLLSKHPLDAFSASEVAENIGTSYAVVAGYLRELHTAGSVERTAVKVQGTRKPVYYYYLPNGGDKEAENSA